jgi:hypothetical protein
MYIHRFQTYRSTRISSVCWRRCCFLTNFVLVDLSFFCLLSTVTFQEEENEKRSNINTSKHFSRHNSRFEHILRVDDDRFFFLLVLYFVIHQAHLSILFNEHRFRVQYRSNACPTNVLSRWITRRQQSANAHVAFVRDRYRLTMAA